MTRVDFDAETFVSVCRAALLDSDPPHAVADVVAEAVADGPSIDRALGTSVHPLEPDTLFASPEITVQRIVWRGGARSNVHEHRMWAVVGVYAGAEVNQFYDRGPDGLSSKDARELDPGGVLVLDANVIHEVRNPRVEPTAGLHVYGGDIAGAERSAWDFAGIEVPYADDVRRRREMFQAMWDLAAAEGRTISDDDRLLALDAIWEGCEQRSRCLTPTETRAVVRAAWTRSHPA